MTFKPLRLWKEMRAARHEPETRHELVRIYWTILIVLLFGMGLGGIGYGVWQFTQPLEKKVESEVTLGTPKAPLVRADLQAILNGFDARSQHFEGRREAPVVRDPS